MRRIQVFQQVVEAVRHAHQIGIPHRDIKPNNICVSENGSDAYLIDFGICQSVEDGLILTTTGEPLGNALFSAPDCMPGYTREPGPHSDIYSLGKLLYWLVSWGRHIHREGISPEIIAHIRHEDEFVRFHVSRLLRGTVAEDPDRRWTASDLFDRISEVRTLIQNFEGRKC